MSIHGYIWLCIENEEEIVVEEEGTTPPPENPPAGNCFYFDISRCICHLLAISNSLSLE
jgi:hypothetical protein